MAQIPDTSHFMNSQPLIISHHFSALPLPTTRLRMLAQTLFTGERVPHSKTISAVFCSDYLIKKLNARYRRKNHPTDVLSFSIGDPDFLGEIYISLERARVQARRYGLSYTDEVVRLFIHGFFHLLGYDHLNLPDRLKMEAKEALYFTPALK
jgi:probable rRNA maturation factor